jgi:hypothetical protein
MNEDRTPLINYKLAEMPHHEMDFSGVRYN